jgi:hypothetical protein
MSYLIRRRIVVQSWHRCVSSTALFGRGVLLCALGLLAVCKVHAQSPPQGTKESVAPTAGVACLPDGRGYLRARLAGSIKAELNWGNEGTDCTGAVRPTDGGIRMRFTATFDRAGNNSGEKLVLVFGIATLREGQAAKNVPVNVTIIREGTGEFYGTQGDDKCMLDEVKQEPMIGIPHRSRSYRVVARGFCTEPARAIRGKGVVMISRFDYAGRVDFDSEDATPEEPQVAKL